MHLQPSGGMAPALGTPNADTSSNPRTTINTFGTLAHPADVPVLRMQSSLTPQQAMNSSHEAHIRELVEQKTTLEHTLHKSQTKHHKDLSQLREKIEAERLEWERLLEAADSAHNVGAAEAACALSRAREELLVRDAQLEQAGLLRKRMQYGLLKWMNREAELERAIMLRDREAFAVREELEALKDEVAEGRSEDQRALADQLQSAEEARDAALKESTGLKVRLVCIVNKLLLILFITQKQLNQLKSEYKTLQSKQTQHGSDAERLQLELDSARTSQAALERTRADLQRANGELQRINDDLRAQIERWKQRDDRGGAELGEQRKRETALERRVEQAEEAAEQAREEISTLREAEEEAQRKYAKSEKSMQKYKAAFEQQKVRELDLLLELSDANIWTAGPNP